MPPQFSAGFTNRLVAGLAGSNEMELERCIAVSEALDPGERQVLIAKAAEQALNAGRFEIVDRLFSTLSADEAARLIRDVASRLEAGRAGLERGSAAALSFVADHQDRLDAEQIERIVDKAIAVMSERRQHVAALAPQIARFQVKNAERRLTLVTRLIVFERAVQNLNRRESILRAARSLAGTRQSNARTAIDERLRELRESGAPPEVKMAKRVAVG